MDNLLTEQEINKIEQSVINSNIPDSKVIVETYKRLIQAQFIKCEASHKAEIDRLMMDNSVLEQGMADKQTEIKKMGTIIDYHYINELPTVITTNKTAAYCSVRKDSRKPRVYNTLTKQVRGKENAETKVFHGGVDDVEK